MFEYLLNFCRVTEQDSRIINNLIKNNKIIIDRGKIVSRNNVLGFELAKKIRPSWAAGNIRIFFREAYATDISNGKILAYFIYNKKKYPAIAIESGKLIYGFDPEIEIKNLLEESYVKKSRPLYTYLPFHYHKIPFNRQLNKLLIKFLRDTKKFPSWPIDNSVDTIRYSFLKSVETLTNKVLKTKKIWPNNKKFAIVISHDVDKKDGIRNADKFLELESRKGLRSTWFLLSNYYHIEKSFLDKIVRNKCEIALHGYNHDNKIAYLNESMIKKRLNHGFGKFKGYKLKGFRSPALLTTPMLEKVLSKHFLYDSSVVDTEMFLSDSKNTGCCTVFPFFRNNILHLPITIPIDSLLIFRSFTQNQIYNLWVKKIEHIRKMGGLALLATHTESAYIANKKYFPIYERFINYISKCDDAWIATCFDIATWWNKSQ